MTLTTVKLQRNQPAGCNVQLYGGILNSRLQAINECFLNGEQIVFRKGRPTTEQWNAMGDTEKMGY